MTDNSNNPPKSQGFTPRKKSPTCDTDHNLNEAPKPMVAPSGSRTTAKVQSIKDGGEIDNSFPLANQTPEGFKVNSKEIETLCQEINKELNKNRIDLSVNKEAVQRITDTVFWTGSKLKLYSMNHKDELVQFGERDTDCVFNDINGGILDLDALEDIATELSISKDGNIIRAEKTRLEGVANQVLLKFIKINRQRDNTVMKVDMFAKKSIIKMGEEKAILIYPHKKYELIDAVHSDQIISDYKSFFPEIDDFLDHMVYSRFATDRKKCFHWLHCGSNWGKGFLTNALTNLGAVTEFSSSELSKAISGGPIGKTQADFKRSLVIMFNEFKKVTSDMKQIENSITISPKNMLSVTVDIYLKVFSSAEHVSSLAGDMGVEDQFANRFSYYKGTDKQIDSILNKHGKGKFHKCLQNYIANYLNEMIDGIVALGPDEAARISDSKVTAFHDKNAICKSFDNMDTNMGDLVQRVREWLFDIYSGRIEHRPEIKAAIKAQSNSDSIFLGSVKKVIESYIDDHFSKSELSQIRFKSTQIASALSNDGESARARTIDGKSHWSIEIKDIKSGVK